MGDDDDHHHHHASIDGAATGIPPFRVIVPDHYACAVCCEATIPFTVFDCGHSACGACATKLFQCPECRLPIHSKIRVFQQDDLIRSSLRYHCLTCPWVGTEGESRRHHCERRPAPPEGDEAFARALDEIERSDYRERKQRHEAAKGQLEGLIALARLLDRVDSSGGDASTSNRSAVIPTRNTIVGAEDPTRSDRNASRLTNRPFQFDCPLCEHANEFHPGDPMPLPSPTTPAQLPCALCDSWVNVVVARPIVAPPS